MADDIRDALNYDPETGVLQWKISLGNHIRAGMEAGTNHHTGYRHIELGGRKYLAHRIAWLLMKGAWPETTIDHRNLDKSDNRWGNLREATTAHNNANRRAWSSHGKGVTLIHKRGKYQAQIKAGGRNHFLGLFDTSAEASAAYALKAAELFGEFARSE